MKELYVAIEKLLDYAKKNLELNSRNEDYIRAEIFRILGLNSYTETYGATSDVSQPDPLLAELKEACIQYNIFEDGEEEFYFDQIMGSLSLLPSDVEKRFYQIEEKQGSQAATEWFYNYSVKNDYVKKARLDKNIRFDAKNGLVVTINLSKPEFRDMKKAASGNAVAGGYPKCSICHENEGFAGRNKKTLRTINLDLDGQYWFWQFSPYGYFYQHGICVNYEHIPMHVDKSTFSRLMDFVDRFPHYFIGSNAALPRIGGSVLAHDHYQGGGEILPMHKAGAWKTYELEDAILEIVEWPGTVIRVISKNRKTIEDVCEKIRKTWVSYNNPELEIIAEDENGIHNAISPTVIKTNRGYEVSIILRSNMTNETYPDGIFHAHPEFHIIKKESIGLIEAQGLLILPGRLEKQLAKMEECLRNGKELPKELEEFAFIYSEVLTIGGDPHEAIKTELESVCYRILQNTAVFSDRNLTIDFLKQAGVLF